ncbi:MAG: hypothetical protein KBB88_02650 [Candidatus Pacebacteria bacterium]|nr:hypothetical protein [Candidatus Paceibacterota bacterium]
MVRLQPRHRVPKAMASIPVLLIMCFLIVSLGIGITQMIIKTRTTSQQKKEAENELTVLKDEHEKLTENINSLETDEGKIQTLRNNYRVGTEGEKLVVIVKQENPEMEEQKKPIQNFFHALFNPNKE